MNELLKYLVYFLMAYFFSCVLLVTFKTVLKNKKIENIKEKWFDNYFLIIVTIYNLICLAIYFKK